MPPIRLAVATLLLAASVPWTAAAEESVSHVAISSASSAPGLLQGVVTRDTAPVPAVRIYAYQLIDRTVRRAVTDATGRFLFEALPAGLYKIIAHKGGFAPAVALLSRASAEAEQQLELELSPEPDPEPGAEEDFWSLRGEIPGDVLRDVDIPELAAIPVALASFSAKMNAVSGLGEVGAVGASQMSGGGVDVDGRLGALKLRVVGDFLALEPTVARAVAVQAGGETKSLSLELEGPAESHLDLRGSQHRMVTLLGGDPLPVDFEQVRVAWSRPLGSAAETGFAAQYTSENNFFNPRGEGDPRAFPASSRSIRFEGSYAHEVSDRASFQAGVSFRQREGAFQLQRRFRTTLESAEVQTVDLFGQGGWRVQPALLVEYGLYSTLVDGSLALMPRGGVVVQLGQDWQAGITTSQRVPVDSEELYRADFLTGFYDEARPCEQSEANCYLLTLTRRNGEEESFTLSASQREFDRAVRLYFNDHFFDYQESLFLVPGDRVAEVQVGVSRRLAPRIHARIESSLATGGGGVFFANSGRHYENELQYLVTSLDTHFQATSTGVFVAFHHLEQQGNPLGRNRLQPQVELQRLELMVTQDLNVLIDLAADWALRLSMELSRGNAPFLLSDDLAEPDQQIRRRLLGGLAVRF